MRANSRERSRCKSGHTSRAKCERARSCRGAFPPMQHDAHDAIFHGLDVGKWFVTAAVVLAQRRIAPGETVKVAREVHEARARPIVSNDRHAIERVERDHRL